MQRIGVFCGSRNGSLPQYGEMADALGEALVKSRIDLVTGGGDIGLMKQISDAVLRLGGNVVGVIPEFLYEKEVAHLGLTELIVVDTMHQRKAKVAELSDGLITLPGGFGTLDETFEMLTWNQLHLHHKPFGLLNINGYFDKLLEFIDRMVQDKFLKPDDRNMIQVSEDPDELLLKMKKSTLPSNPKWVGVRDKE